MYLDFLPHAFLYVSRRVFINFSIKSSRVISQRYSLVNNLSFLLLKTSLTNERLIEVKEIGATEREETIYIIGIVFDDDGNH